MMRYCICKCLSRGKYSRLCLVGKKDIYGAKKHFQKARGLREQRNTPVARVVLCLAYHNK